jgi:hypothetical protein
MTDDNAALRIGRLRPTFEIHLAQEDPSRRVLPSTSTRPFGTRTHRSISEDDHMSTDVIGSRYRLGSVMTCTPEATTWDARDT